MTTDSISGITLATYFKYFSQIKRNGGKIPKNYFITRVGAKTEYIKYKVYFDKLLTIHQKYPTFNGLVYIKFCVNNLNMKWVDVPKKLLDRASIVPYIEHKNKIKQYVNIYNNFMKSVNNIVNDCMINNFSSVKEYLQYLIKTNQLVYKYMSGKISIYYICSLQNFTHFINNMDNISRAEFEVPAKRCDKYRYDLMEAFRYLKASNVETLKFTEQKLQEKFL